MTTPSPLDNLEPYHKLAIRAMTCSKWRIRNGVLDLRGSRIQNLPPLDGFSVVFCLPDFRDEATLACLLDRVREAWKDPTIEVRTLPDASAAYPFSVTTATRIFVSDTEAEALLLALENAP